MVCVVMVAEYHMLQACPEPDFRTLNQAAQLYLNLKAQFHP